MRLFDTPLTELGKRDREAWAALAARRDGPRSPYLSPQFAELVDSERGDVRVLIAEQSGQIAGFFAYHAATGGIVRPVGAPLSDYQGFAAAPGFRIESRRMLDAMGVGALVYDNWVGAAPGRQRGEGRSVLMDVSGGAGAWSARQRAVRTPHAKKMDQRRRKAEREFGPIRVEFTDPDGERFATLQAWKSAQYRASGLTDLFAEAWTARVIERAAKRRFGPMTGLVASLYLGDRLAAVETGLVAFGTYHSWIPAYDPEFRSVSPGLILLEAIAEAAPRLDMGRIDLGHGHLDYKRHYGDFTQAVVAGRALQPGFAGARVAAWEIAEAAGALLPGRLAAAPAKLRRRWAQTAAIAPCYRARMRLMANAVAAAPKRLGA